MQNVADILDTYDFSSMYEPTSFRNTRGTPCESADRQNSTSPFLHSWRMVVCMKPVHQARDP